MGTEKIAVCNIPAIDNMGRQKEVVLVSPQMRVITPTNKEQLRKITEDFPHNLRHVGAMHLAKDSGGDSTPVKLKRCGGKFLCGNDDGDGLSATCSACKFHIKHGNCDEFTLLLLQLALKQMIPDLPYGNYINCSLLKPPTDWPHMYAKHLLEAGFISVGARTIWCRNNSAGGLSLGNLGFTLRPGLQLSGEEDRFSGWDNWVAALLCQLHIITERRMKAIENSLTRTVYGPVPR